jgi:uncharacterized protein (UPF0332 family)
MSDLTSLLAYRMGQAESTPNDAVKMSQSGVGPRSIVNRCYYAMFYATLALFLKAGIAARTSRHSGVIGRFNKEFVQTGKIEKKYSKMLDGLFDSRQEFDYKEFSETLPEDAESALNHAREFVTEIKRLVHE